MKKLRVKSELRELETIRRFLHRCLRGVQLSEEDLYKVELSLIEMCTNIMRYAYPHRHGEIHISAWYEKARFWLELRDGGTAFDPKTAKRPSLREMINREQMGGLGIFLARHLMDDFDYRREDDENVLTMSKRASRKA
jgi:anti-sigma regulatory factor (Ser/Thr protein kinase)